jgi:uncharacterized protein (TIGR00725 family)
MTDHGFTHIAIECSDLDRSIAFYERYGGFEIVHRRDGIAWISDRTRPFAIVLAEVDDVHPLGPFPHLGVACKDRAAFDLVVANARAEGCLRSGPAEGTGPAGTWAFIDDPDGNTLEVSIGQSVESAVRGGAQQPRPQRLPIVGVMGSGVDEHVELAEPLGRGLAELGAHVLTGGGGGVMRAVARGFTGVRQRAGLSIGILPGDEQGNTSGCYPNAFIEVPIRTHLPHSGHSGTEVLSRNHLNALTAAAIVVLPGGAGTASELELAGRYRTPVIAHESWTRQGDGMPTWKIPADALAWVRQQCF